MEKGVALDAAGPADVSSQWRSEYEADGFAARASIRTILKAPAEPAGSDPLFELLAVELQPMLQVLVSSAQDYLAHGGIPRRPEGEGTHPPADRRFAHVRASIDAALRDSPMVDDDLLDTVRGLVDFIVWALLPPLRDKCLELRRSGVRPV